MRCKRGTFAKQRQPFVPQINVRITEEQLLWLSSQVKPFRNKSAVIRDLIDLGIQGVDAVAKLATCAAGGSEPVDNLRPLIEIQQSLKQPASAAGEQPPLQLEAVQSLAKEHLSEKNTINVKNQKKREKHALRPLRAHLSSRLFGSVTKPVNTLFSLSPRALP